MVVGIDDKVVAESRERARAGFGLDLDSKLIYAGDAGATEATLPNFYPSRLPGEPVDGVDAIHFHSVLPRSSACRRG